MLRKRYSRMTKWSNSSKIWMIQPKCLKHLTLSSFPSTRPADQCKESSPARVSSTRAYVTWRTGSECSVEKCRQLDISEWLTFHFVLTFWKTTKPILEYCWIKLHLWVDQHRLKTGLLRLCWLTNSRYVCVTFQHSTLALPPYFTSLRRSVKRVGARRSDFSCTLRNYTHRNAYLIRSKANLKTSFSWIFRCLKG